MSKSTLVGSGAFARRVDLVLARLERELSEPTSGVVLRAVRVRPTPAFRLRRAIVSARAALSGAAARIGIGPWTYDPLRTHSEDVATLLEEARRRELVDVLARELRPFLERLAVVLEDIEAAYEGRRDA